MGRHRLSEVELQAGRWLRALGIAKILFEEEGYHTHYLEELEQFLQRSEVRRHLPQRSPRTRGARADGSTTRHHQVGRPQGLQQQ